MGGRGLCLGHGLCGKNGKDVGDECLRQSGWSLPSLRWARVEGGVEGAVEVSGGVLELVAVLVAVVAGLGFWGRLGVCLTLARSAHDCDGSDMVAHGEEQRKEKSIKPLFSNPSVVQTAPDKSVAPSLKLQPRISRFLPRVSPPPCCLNCSSVASCQSTFHRIHHLKLAQGPGYRAMTLASANDKNPTF